MRIATVPQPHSTCLANDTANGHSLEGSGSQRTDYQLLRQATSSRTAAHVPGLPTQPKSSRKPTPCKQAREPYCKLTQTRPMSTTMLSLGTRRPSTIICGSLGRRGYGTTREVTDLLIWVVADLVPTSTTASTCVAIGAARSSATRSLIPSAAVGTNREIHRLLWRAAYGDAR